MQCIICALCSHAFHVFVGQPNISGALVGRIGSILGHPNEALPKTRIHFATRADVSLSGAGGGHSSKLSEGWVASNEQRSTGPRAASARAEFSAMMESENSEGETC